eukprot:TRINITY_DN48402_c0_g1_i1.p1 TRINITY_DN48402_c0_g1~~TRINITY_DN48402_c0_g1_i1.p1  ORF type:complete len:711 (+),score=114.71 TRINITY_DN48402_c0_g1_i1:87-2219(+)
MSADVGINPIELATGEDDVLQTLTEEQKKRVRRACLNKTENIDEEFFHDVTGLQKEDEVQMAEMEGRLRRMIIDVLKPTVQRATRLQTEYDVLAQRYEAMRVKLHDIMDTIKESKSRTDCIAVFQQQLEKFWSVHHELEAKLAKFERDTSEYIEISSRDFDAHKAQLFRFGRSVDNTIEEVGDFKTQLLDLHVSVEAEILRNKEILLDEVKRVDNDVRDVVEMQKTFMEEVWGPENCEDISPPSLHKLDMQMRNANSLLSQAMRDIVDLHRLDTDVLTIRQQQCTADDQLQALTVMTTKLDKRLDQVSHDTQSDMKRTSNLMSAFSANLMKEARQNVEEDLKKAKKFRDEVQRIIEHSQQGYELLEEGMTSLRSHIEALTKEMRIDMETLEERRKRDKISLEEEMHCLSGRVDGSFDTSESTLRGLEHVSGVLSMSLQSQRMSVALDLQDFVDRMETPYVGVNETDAAHVKPRAYLRSTDSTRRPGIELAKLVRLSYKPKQLCFVGTTFERAQLLALRERVVHAAQTSLRDGPVASRVGTKANVPSKLPRRDSAVKNVSDVVDFESFCIPTKEPAPPIVGSLLGSAADFSTVMTNPSTSQGRYVHSSPSARPLSRSQPCGKGSPTLDFDKRSVVMTSDDDRLFQKTSLSGDGSRSTVTGGSSVATTASPGMLLPPLELQDSQFRSTSSSAPSPSDSTCGRVAPMTPMSAR